MPEFRFRAPNPKQWHRQFDRTAWLSGEVAAAEHDGYNLVPERYLVYVDPKDWRHALQSALEIFADVAAPAQANLLIREADPWLNADDEKPFLVEKGQRLLDYASSRHVQILRGLRPLA